LIEVDYEPLPVVSDPVKAMENGSPLAHRIWELTWRLPEAGSGDIEAAFQQADRVVASAWSISALAHAIEPRGCIASWHAGEESLTLWTSTQIPTRRTLLRA